MGIVAIFGGAGFVGATFAERLLRRGEHEVRLCIHTTGNAWRLSRWGRPLQQVDVRERKQVREAVAGVTHVVNCTLGHSDVMYDGLDNLLRESLAAGVERFVHLSSVSAYGVQPTGTPLREDASPSSDLSIYGKMKLEQDRRVMAACRRGLPSVVLAPPNISGAYSPFLLRILSALQDGSLVLIDEGALPCSLIDVENLSHAMELGLSCERADASRYIVTDEQDITWLDLVRALLPLTDRDLPLPSVNREEALRLTVQAETRPSVLATMRTLGSILTSPHARAVFKQDALARRMYDLATERMPRTVGSRIRSLLTRRGVVAAGVEPRPPIDLVNLGVQTRAVRHVGEGARAALGFRPELDFERSMEAFRCWYERTHGFGTEDWVLLKNL